MLFIYATLVVALNVTIDDVTAEERIRIILAALQISSNVVVFNENVSESHIPDA